MIWFILYFVGFLAAFCKSSYEGEDLGGSLLCGLFWPTLLVFIPVIWVHDKLYHLGRKRRNHR